jgi:hypothetical protein
MTRISHKNAFVGVLVLKKRTNKKLHLKGNFIVKSSVLEGGVVQDTQKTFQFV